MGDQHKRQMLVSRNYQKARTNNHWWCNTKGVKKLKLDKDRLNIDVAASHSKDSYKILGLQSNTLQTRLTQFP